MTVVLVRHGESDFNREHRFCGWLNGQLTAKGREEAIQAGQALSADGIRFQRAFCSVLDRSIDSLNLMLETLNLEWIEVVKDWRLNERHYGELQAQSKIDSIHAYPKDKLYEWRRSFEGCPPRLAWDDPMHPRFDPRYRTLDAEMLPAGESLAMTQVRVLACFDELIRPCLNRHENVLVSLHANSMRALLQTLLNTPPETIDDLYIPTGVPLVLNDVKGEFVTRYLGDEALIRQNIRKQKDNVALLGKKNLR